MKKKTPVNISRQRADATKYSDVVSWFDKYEDVLRQLGITDPHCIYNVDEHGTEHSPIVKKYHRREGEEVLSDRANRETQSVYNAHVYKCCRVCTSTNGDT